jgi:NADH-quinone oxidoreductase subunit N
VVASVIGAYYYLRIVYLMYFGAAAQPMTGTMPVLHGALLAASALAMVLGVINMFGVEGLAASAAATLVQ